MLSSRSTDPLTAQYRLGGLLQGPMVAEPSTAHASTARGSRSMTAHTHRISPSLPNELTERIVRELDANLPADRQALTNLLRTSSAFWELAAPLLYHSLKFEHDELIWLLDGRCDDPDHPWETPPPIPALSERKRRSLTFTHRIRIGGIIPDHTLRRLVALSLPDTPFFPSVDELCLAGPNDLDHFWERDSGIGSPPPQDFILFDSPNVCASVWSAFDQLHWLPMRGMQSFTYHGFDARQHLGQMPWDKSDTTGYTTKWIPPDWTAFQIYDDTGGESVRHALDTHAWLQSLRVRRPGIPPIEYLEYGGKESLSAQDGYPGPSQDFSEAAVNTKAYPMIKISTYNDYNCSQAPGCVVCGKTFLFLSAWGHKWKAFQTQYACK